MKPAHELLRAAREAGGVPRDLFAKLVGIEPARFVALESGTERATDSELGAVARTLGLRLWELLAGDFEGAPLPLLFRSDQVEGRPSLEALAQLGAHWTLGEFMQAVRCLDEAERAVGRGARPLPRPVVASVAATGEAQSGDPDVALGIARAAAARSALVEAGLLRTALEPVASMRELLAKLDVALFILEDDQLDAGVAGVSTIAPRPALLANYCGRWKLRMTLAHELGHVLFDMHAAEHRLAVFSPRPPRRGDGASGAAPLGRFARLERTANVFAACFLAPGDAVRAAVGTRSPTTRDAYRIVRTTFGVGGETAINRLQDVFQLSDGVREWFEASHAQWGSPAPERFASDAIREGETGLWRGVVLERVLEARRAGALSVLRARELLGLDDLDDLPDDPALGELGPSPVTPEARARRTALAVLAGDHPGELLYVGSVQRDPGGWRVSVVQWERGRTGDAASAPPMTSAGWLLLDTAAETLVEDHVAAAAR